MAQSSAKSMHHFLYILETLLASDNFLTLYTCNYLIRRDTVTQMIIKGGMADVMVDVIRHGLSERGKKPLLASIGMMAEDSEEVQVSAVEVRLIILKYYSQML